MISLFFCVLRLNSKQSKISWRKTIKYFFNIIDKRPLYKKYITRESISRASDSQIVKRVYNELTKTNYSNEIKKPKNNVSYSTGKKITNKAADKLINKGLNALFKNLFK